MPGRLSVQMRIWHFRAVGHVVRWVGTV